MGRDRQEHQGIFTAPMDHSYRANMGMDSGNGNGRPRRPGFSASYPVADPEPLPAPREDAASRVFAFVEDLFFLSKIQDTGRKMNVKVEFVKTDEEQRRRAAFPDHLRLEQRKCQALDAHPETEKQVEEGDVDHWIPLARAGRFEAEGARSRM
jgi:hypothetical protein